VTDHRISLSVSGVERIMSGEAMYTLTDALGEYDEKEKLARFIDKISNRDDY
jgi:protein subunit release factor A